jgi:hypothetical protein
VVIVQTEFVGSASEGVVGASVKVIEVKSSGRAAAAVRMIRI